MVFSLWSTQLIRVLILRTNEGEGFILARALLSYPWNVSTAGHRRWRPPKRTTQGYTKPFRHFHLGHFSPPHLELLTVFAADAYWGSGFTAHSAEEDCALWIEMFSSFMLQGHPESYPSGICWIKGISLTCNFTVASLDFYLSLAYKLLKNPWNPSFQPIVIWQLKKDYCQRGLVKKNMVSPACLLVGNRSTVKSWALLESGFPTDCLSPLKLASQPVKGSTFSSLKWR